MASAIVQQYEDASADLEATQAITELQIDLKNTIALANEIKAENKDLKEQLESAHSFSKANLQRHADWKETWKAEREIVTKREKLLEKNEAQWKAKLEEMKRELNELEKKKTLVGGDSVNGSLGSELLKEIQREHAEKVEKLQNEANKWRDQLYSTRKSHEETRSRHDASQSQLEREKEVAESYQKEIALLQQAFADHVEESGRRRDMTSSEVIAARDLKLQLVEKELRVEKLQQEVKCALKARDDAVCSKDELVASHQAEQRKVVQKCDNLEVLNRKLERGIEVALKETAQVTSLNAELKEALVDAEKEVDRLRETFAAREGEYKKEADRLRKDRETSELQLKKQVDKAKSMLLEEQAKTRELEQRCLETQEHAMKQIAELAKDIKQDDGTKEKLLIAQADIIKLENTIDDLQSEMNQQNNNHHADVQRLQHSCESCHKELNLVLLEKAETDKERARAVQRAVQLKKDLEESERSMQKLASRYQLLIDDKAKLSQKIEDLTDMNSSLESKVNYTLEHMRVLEEQTSSERVNAEEALHNEVGKVKQLLEKEKRRSNAYKTKALESHRRSVKAKEVLEKVLS